ncbi:MAG TPA: ATP-binding protein [Dermatophilaceae bacterium]|nr:ATP-binding protein [Dermatophilaceae bacterium]
MPPPQDAPARLILDGLPDGLLVADGDGLVSYVNERAARLLGRTASRVVGEPIRRVLPLTDEGGAAWWDCIDPWGGLTIRTGHPERRLHLPGIGHVLVTMRYLRPAPSAPVERVVVSVRDDRARARAEAANGELLSVVAHELRAPLASVKGFSGVLLRRWDRFADADRRSMVATVHADATRLARLVEELLDVARIDTRRLRVIPRRVDLGLVVAEQLRRAVDAGLDADRVRWSPIADPPVPVWADPRRLEQILTNLIENAGRHGAGRVWVDIEPPASGVTGGEVGRMVRVVVSDQGAGVPVEHRSLVFEKFWHGRGPGTAASTGLGLYLVRGLVQAHGGSVGVEPGTPGGARFWFTLPAVADQPPAARNSAASPLAGPLGSAGPR